MQSKKIDLTRNNIYTTAINTPVVKAINGNDNIVYFVF